MLLAVEPRPKPGVRYSLRNPVAQSLLRWSRDANRGATVFAMGLRLPVMTESEDSGKGERRGHGTPNEPPEPLNCKSAKRGVVPDRSDASHERIRPGPAGAPGSAGVNRDGVPGAAPGLGP